MLGLPETGRPAADILGRIAALREADLPTHGGRLFAYVYDSGLAGLDELTAATHALGASVNGLDPTAFPSRLAMENAIVGAAATLLGGGAGVVGNLTSGGTESLILAVKTARDAHPSTDPELVIPSTAHAAFAKAASYLRVRPVVVPVSAPDFTPSVVEVAAAITDDTVLVACSAPSYAHGVVDPVAEIAAVAAARGVRCHVDACFGGWTLPYLRRLGVEVPPFDLSVPGVTSISVDLHKYAYCPKGVSVLLHRNEALRAAQYFAYAGWPGYTMVNPTIASTRSGGPVAAAFATLQFLGDEGYLRLARTTLESVRELTAAVSDVDGLRVLAPGSSTVVVFVSDDAGLDLFVLADELALRGWHTQPQLAYEGLPRSVHLTVTASVAPQLPQFRADLAAAVAAARSLGPVTLDPSIVEFITALTPDQLNPDTVAAIASGLGFALTDDGPPLPERRAELNTMVEAAPVPVREALFAAFLSLLQRPTFS
jgi:glutamate/tyrosine decarboxylase-like PLP-dependent enzyme